MTFLSIFGLFLLLATVISLGLGMASPESDMKIIIKNALKNFWFLCLMIVSISVFATLLRIIL
jgi:hypothetical protein